MPEETTPSQELPPDGIARRLDRLERRLLRDRRGWRIALLAILAAIAAGLFLIAIAIFTLACHHRRPHVVIAPGMGMGGYGNMPYYWRSGPPAPPWSFQEHGGPWVWGPQGLWPTPRPRSGPGAPERQAPRMPSQPSPTPNG